MNADLSKRLDKILGRLTSDSFLKGEGLGNEIPFYAFDYPPESELEVRQHIAFLLTQIPKIRPGIRLTHVDDLDFDLEAGQANEAAVEEVLNAITLLSSQNRQIVLHDLVETRFGRRPYGWPDWEVILLVARLVMRGDISLVMDGTTLTPERLRAELMPPNKWRRMTVVKRKSVDKGVLQKARTVAKEVFGKSAERAGR